MNSKMIFPLALFACTLLPARANSQAPTAESLLKITNGTYVAFQAKDGNQMQALTTPDFTYVGSEGILSGQALGEATKSCTLRSFTLTSPKMTMLSPTSATLTYTVHQDESCGGSTVPPVLFNEDVFVRSGGKWLVATHMEATASDQTK